MAVRPIAEGAFRFLPTTRGYQVFHKSRLLGEIVSMRERNGRHCFRLALDSRSAPKTIRGRVRAAQVLKSVVELGATARRRKWPIELLILVSKQLDEDSA